MFCFDITCIKGQAMLIKIQIARAENRSSLGVDAVLKQENGGQGGHH